MGKLHDTTACQLDARSLFRGRVHMPQCLLSLPLDEQDWKDCVLSVVFSA